MEYVENLHIKQQKTILSKRDEYRGGNWHSIISLLCELACSRKILQTIISKERKFMLLLENSPSHFQKKKFSDLFQK